MATLQSPFKFLDAYTKADKDVFFGRDKEISQLYQLVRSSPLVLVYGVSGIGKTSLINCGLNNKFEPNDWLPLFIKRGDNILESMDDELQMAAESYLPLVEIDDLGQEVEFSISTRLKLLYLEHYKPICLIFDQFEELFILGKQEEQRKFFIRIKEILESNVQCRIILSMREEFLARLSPFEQIIPSLFSHRLRVETMNREDLSEVITQTLASNNISMTNSNALVETMLDNLQDKGNRVDLINLQIYLDRLYKEAYQPGKRIVFDQALTKRVGQLQDILGDYLKEQIDELETTLAQRGIKQRGIPFDLLFELVSTEETKQARKVDELTQDLQQIYSISQPDIQYCLEQFKAARIIKDVN